MNNIKFDYAKKYHYLIKYILMAIPLFLLILSYLFPIKQIENYYSGTQTTTSITNSSINYNQLYTKSFVINQTKQNVVITNDISNYDFNISGFYTYGVVSEVPITSSIVAIPNHKYFVGGFDFAEIGAVSMQQIDLHLWYNNNLTSWINLFNDSVVVAPNSITDFTVYIEFGPNNLDNSFDYNFNLNIVDLTSMFGAGNEPTLTEFKRMFPFPKLEYSSGQLLMLYDVQTTNTINDNSSLISTDEIKVNNTVYLKPLNDFYKLNINSWYDSLLTALNINVDNDTTYYIYHIPLYIIYFYIFDIILDIFAIIFRLGHKMINKFGGDY